MDEYNNIPVGWNGPDMVLYTRQLPDKYQVMGGGGVNKEHICSHYNVQEYSTYSKGQAFCGLEVVGTVEGVSIHPCETCLNILNKEMEGYLYDELNEEYYDPRS